MKNYLLVSGFIFAFLFLGCFSSSKQTKQNIASLYLPQSLSKQSVVDFEFTQDGKSIVLLFKLSSLNVKRNVNNLNAKLTLNLYNNAKTSSSLREIVQPVQFNNLNAKFNFEAIDNYDLLGYRLESENLVAPLTGFLRIDKFSSNDILIKKNSGNTNASYLINKEEIGFKVQGVTVSYFDTKGDIALPPYITDKKRLIKEQKPFAKTILTELNFTPQQTGYYLFESKEKNRSLLCVNNSFPKIKDYKVLIPSLRYITKNEELKQVSTNKNLEKALDSFWLSIGNNKARATKLKQEYLLRLETSNKYFSSIVPGWQTDRGMIYIIFGPPNEVYKTEEGENWYYSEPKIQFKFMRKVVINNYNHYQLQRSENLALYWHRAVNKWRNGHIKPTEVLE